jgi:small GTP-binding protein
MSYNYAFKYILVGDSGTGKSCILHRFSQSEFISRYDTTIGVEFDSKTIWVNDKKIKISLWDTAGQEIFLSITQQYFKESAVAILVYDISNYDSFKNIMKWLPLIRKNNSPHIEILLVGNKIDYENTRQVKRKEGEDLAKKEGISFFECSALSGIGIEEIFTYSTTKILNKLLNNPYIPGVRYGLEKDFDINFKNNQKCCIIN